MSNKYHKKLCETYLVGNMDRIQTRGDILGELVLFLFNDFLRYAKITKDY